MKKTLLLLSLLLVGLRSFAQDPYQTWHSGQIQQALQHTQVLGSVLYMAAHPDDENTRLIAYTAKGMGLRTGYLSLTRGDGGQNLIGKEVRELLGVIRTQELLAARRTDGGVQYFSRANDFGFSKHPDETLRIWEEDEVLSDAVWVIRKFRPDVIVTRFSPGRAGSTHGHHTASAMLAIEAAKAASDPARFPEQLKYVQVWKPKRVVWNTSSWFFSGPNAFDASKYMQLDIGQYSPLLGQSYNEIAAHSRTMHKSQGFGSAIARGSTLEYFQHLYGDSSTTQNIFEGLDFSWNRIEGGAKIAKMLQKLAGGYHPSQPQALVPGIIEVLTKLKELPQDNFWVQQKTEDLSQLLLQCAGVYLEANAKDYEATAGEQVPVSLQYIQRHPQAKVQLKEIAINGIQHSKPDSLLRFNQLHNIDLVASLPQNAPNSQPYWLRSNASLGMYFVPEQPLRGTPENAPVFALKATFAINNYAVSASVPVRYKWTDPVDGQRYRPFVVAPKATVSMKQEVYVHQGREKKQVKVVVKAHQANCVGQVWLEAPAGWSVSPVAAGFNMADKYAEQEFSFELTPLEGASTGDLRAKVQVGEEVSDFGLVTINYDHIPMQTLFPRAQAKLVYLSVQKRGQRIAYLSGAGDGIPDVLRQLGYQVDLLEEADIRLEQLMKYDAVVAGVRTYNTIERIKFYQEALMKYVENGGNYVVQYNTSNGLKTNDLGPYPFKLSRERVTVEEAPVSFLLPEHALLQAPNAIGFEDFEGWVQERGLYFVGEWDEQYQALLSCSDPGEPERKGGLLVAHYGKGTYIYTGYSWFRQLPAGVPGAIKLFVNLISYRQP